MNSIKKSILILGIAIIAACAETRFNWEDPDLIHPGMTEAEVIAIIGEPYSRKSEGEKTRLTWSYATGGGFANAVSHLFEDGVVVEQDGTVGK